MLAVQLLASVTVTARELARWSESLAAIARTGLGFTDNLYERERFEEILHVAADIKAAARELDPDGILNPHVLLDPEDREVLILRQWQALLRRSDLRRIAGCDAFGQALEGRTLPYQLEVLGPR